MSPGPPPVGRTHDRAALPMSARPAGTRRVPLSGSRPPARGWRRTCGDAVPARATGGVPRLQRGGVPRGRRPRGPAAHRDRRAGWTATPGKGGQARRSDRRRPRGGWNRWHACADGAPAVADRYDSRRRRRPATPSHRRLGGPRRPAGTLGLHIAGSGVPGPENCPGDRASSAGRCGGKRDELAARAGSG